jgi:hypothetical protein
MGYLYKNHEKIQLIALLSLTSFTLSAQTTEKSS